MATIIRHGDGFQSKIRRKGFDPVSRTFPTHKLAKEWATRIEAEMFSGRYISRDEAESTTLREWGQFWVKFNRLRSLSC